MKSLLNLLCMIRVESHLENRIAVNEEYQKLTEEFDEILEKLLVEIEDRKEKERIDEVLSICNILSAKYGEIAYEEGMKDGIQVMKEILEV
ncbi:MAG: hypothetical protein KH020_16700 [Clostridiales bacterium]|nr:hypothetical protein [Clostridiales bacterium]